MSGPSTGRARAFRLVGFAVEVDANELVATDGCRVRLEARAMDVLELLHRHAGEVVPTEEILARVWGGSAVSAHSVAIVVSDLRRALGDDARAPRYIATVPKRGYRLLASAIEGRAAEIAAAPSRARSVLAVGAAAALALVVLGAIVRDAGAGRSFDPDLVRRYEQARALWSRREPEGARAARELLERVIAAREDFAPAHAALADLYVHKTGEYLGVTPLEAFRAGQRHLDRALELDPGQPDAHVTAALLAFYRDRLPARALAAIDRALGLDPALARAWHARAMVLSALGEHAESLVAIRRARELDPVSPSAAWDEVWYLYLAGRYEEAAAAATRAASYSPRNLLYEALISEARGERRRALALWLARAEQLGVVLARPEEVRRRADAGDLPSAYRELLRQRRAAPGVEADAVLAAWELLAGELDAAARTLGAVPVEREGWISLWLAEMPIFATVVERPEVRVFLRRSGFAAAEGG